MIAWFIFNSILLVWLLWASVFYICSLSHVFFFFLINNALFGSSSWKSHRAFIESTAVTTVFWLDQYGGRFASIFRRCQPSMYWGQCVVFVNFLTQCVWLTMSTTHTHTLLWIRADKLTNSDWHTHLIMRQYIAVHFLVLLAAPESTTHNYRLPIHYETREKTNYLVFIL